MSRRVQPDLVALERWLLDQPEVEAAWVFGSRARGAAREDSDLDLAVLASPRWDRRPDPLREAIRFGIAAAAAARIPPDALDLVVVQDASPLLVRSVLTEGRLLADKDPDTRVEWQLGAMHRWLEAERLQQAGFEARQERRGASGP